MWSRKTENCILSVYFQSGDPVRMAAVEPNTSSLDKLKVDPISPADTTLGEISVVTALTPNEAFDNVIGARQGAGPAWRRLNRLYDPGVERRSPRPASSPLGRT